jgi:hypothetical protein
MKEHKILSSILILFKISTFTQIINAIIRYSIQAKGDVDFYSIMTSFWDYNPIWLKISWIILLIIVVFFCVIPMIIDFLNDKDGKQ